jgi:hypothetical protein
MIASPPIGAIAFGKSGIPYQVIECHSQRVTLRCPDESLIDVEPSAIVRWEHCVDAKGESESKVSFANFQPKADQPPTVGDWVRLRGGDAIAQNPRYRVLELFQVYAGVKNGEPIHEVWAKLQGHDGGLAYWKLNQLEVLND